MSLSSQSRAYQTGVAIAFLTALLTAWATIGRDDGTGTGSFMVIAAAAVGAIAAWFRPAGMARAMAGVAVMQLSLGLLLATDTSIAARPDGPLKALAFGVGLAALWLVSSAYFRSAARDGRKAAAAAH
jgi:hypothetical protein